ncbi:hypothetical protein CFP71_01745 [Amycolatopsis thailandensis]|uniref:Tyr recombinase domain-containing protein n=1 Tax=Amycolatopsis thailandensis TaxID=589330 RepID=A0A229SIC6_9PSEU|nr:tyrosine-type recombinase/integrase [Amycolatopsis thailandensis]OXM58612.1 hypothetical protein CFP71_01745 [Amycolatopsis thailandensis]
MGAARRRDRAQTATFLRKIRGHRLYPLFHLLILLGLRRGEVIGLRWSDIDLEGGYLTVSHQIRQVGATIEIGKPKSDTSNRVIALDHGTITLLRRHLDAHHGDPAGYMFLNVHSHPIRPDALTSLFRLLNTRSERPPIRLHDLRNGAASLCLVGLGAGVAMTLTNDLIMSSVRPEESGQAAAISETAYELGTAFGTAILGSVLLGFYRAGLDDTAPSGLPGGILDSAKETLAAALLHARELTTDLGAALYTAATDSFTSALSWTGGIAALILLAVAIFAAVMLRGISAQEDLSDADH